MADVMEPGSEEDPGSEHVSNCTDDEDTVLAPLRYLRTTAFWRLLDSSPGQADAISEWIKLALVLLQVHDSCEDERMFSAMHVLPQDQVEQVPQPAG